MVIVPCSSNTLAEVAHGLGDNLISRAAAVTLKERRRLVLAHREMPLSAIDVNSYKVLTDAEIKSEVAKLKDWSVKSPNI